MNISRRSFLAGATGLVTGLGSLDLASFSDEAGAAPASIPARITLPRITLRGYGPISAVFQSLAGGQASLTHIHCESQEKALLVQAKYLSDLGLLPGTQDDALAIAGHAIPIRRTMSGGAIACYADGHDVLILAAGLADFLKPIIGEFTPGTRMPAHFQPRARVPMYLDRWDRYGLLIYYAPMRAPAGVPFPGDAYDYNQDLKFVRENGAGLVIWANASHLDTGEGLTNDIQWEWVQQNARKMGIPLHINTNNNWPVLWLSNRFRSETQLKMPQYLGGFYDVGWQSGSMGAMSWLSQAGEDAQLGVQQSIVRRFAPDPNIVGWLEPHGETGQLPQSLFCEYGATADESIRQYLKQRFHTLPALSRRWHGDPGHYQSWDEVHAPELAEFAGLGPEAIDLQGSWRVRYVAGPNPSTARVPPEWYQPAFDDSTWDELVAPGNDRMLSMPRTPLTYRRSIDVPAAWLTGQPEITLYLWDLSDRPEDELIVYLNGTKLAGQARVAIRHRWLVFNVTKSLKPGANLLAMSVPHAAICYRTYLTTTPPAQYPDLGPQRNAQWADYNAWTLWSRMAQIQRAVQMIRQVDPNRSINHMAPGDDMESIAALCREYGGCMHDTGAMAGFWTEQNSLMMAGAGLPATAEPGNGAPNVAEFQKFWGRWLTEGLNGIHYFQHLGEITWNPEVLAEFLKNRRMYQAIGKYHVPKADVAILFSTRNYRLTSFPWDPHFTDRWSPGGYYSGANPAGPLLDYCPRDGISDDDLTPSLAARYRIVIDTNTPFWNESLLAGVESYVRAGGIFITNGQTGRHTEEEPDTWPISTLTGYSVVKPQVYGTGLTIAPAPGQTVFAGPQWTGRGAGGLSLKKATPDCQDLLMWSNGATAIGMRPLGKGWIVHVGPSWGGGDEASLLQQLMAHFGVTSRVPATVKSAPGLHFRHYVSNTGLQDLWVLFNESDQALTTDLTFLPGVHPAALAEIVSGKAAPLVRNAAGDSVRDIALVAHQTLMYISPREDVPASPLEWVNLQRSWWQGAAKPPAHHLPTPAEQQRAAMDLTAGWAYKRVDGLPDDQAAALMALDVDDSTWERRDLDTWLTPDDHRAKRIILRRKFTVPARWTAGPVYLSTGGSVSGARTFLDGKPLLDGRSLWDGDNLDAAAGVLKTGSSHLLALDVRGSNPPIGVRDPAWLSYVPDPPARQDLAGPWQGYADALRATGPVQLPGPAANVAFLKRTIVIGPEHRRQNVVIYISDTESSVDAILFNGSRLIHERRTSDHSYVWFDVTPMVRFGEENTIELSLNPSPQSSNLKVVEVRYYEPGL